MSDLQQTFHVIGMTCGHCAAAIEEEVGALDKAGYELVS
jgi:copper chaperone CopZ